MIYIFEDYLLDAARRELRHAGRVVAVEPQVFDILYHLIRNRDRVVSSADLKANVWKGRTVSPSTVGSRIAAVRRVVGDTGDRQRMILTLPRRGHRFVASVREDHEGSDLSVTNRGLGATPDISLPVETSHSQAVTFCRTVDGINLAVAVAGDVHRKALQ